MHAFYIMCLCVCLRIAYFTTSNHYCCLNSINQVQNHLMLNVMNFTVNTYSALLLFDTAAIDGPSI